MSVEVASVCDSDWYGKTCNVYCVDQDTCEGHYICDKKTGAKICLNGFRGENCDISIQNDLCTRDESKQMFWFVQIHWVFLKL